MLVILLKQSIRMSAFLLLLFVPMLVHPPQAEHQKVSLSSSSLSLNACHPPQAEHQKVSLSSSSLSLNACHPPQA
jgi:hypothetical protein